MCLHCVLLSEDKTFSLLQNPSKRYESVLLLKWEVRFSVFYLVECKKATVDPSELWNLIVTIK